MILPPSFTQDLAELPDHAFSHRSLTWWGVVGFMVIEGTAFGLAIAAYFFLMSHEQHWAPPPLQPPGPARRQPVHLDPAAQRNPQFDGQAGGARARRCRRFGGCCRGWSRSARLLLVIRGFEFNSLNVLWYSNAYGSIIWALLLLHTTHVATDWGDTRRARGADADRPRRDPAAPRRYRRERALLAVRVAVVAADLRADLLGAEAVPVKRSSELADLLMPWAGLRDRLRRAGRRSSIRLRRNFRPLPGGQPAPADRRFAAGHRRGGGRRVRFRGGCSASRFRTAGEEGDRGHFGWIGGIVRLRDDPARSLPQW